VPNLGGKPGTAGLVWAIGTPVPVQPRTPSLRKTALEANRPGFPQRDTHTGLVIPFEGLALAA
jgi:hypothetical protein